MKKLILLFAISVLSVGNVMAQTSESNVSTKSWPSSFINLNYTVESIKQTGQATLNSKFGGAFSVGTTYYLHKPIGNMLRFGIDATWFDINYANYKVEETSYYEKDTYQYHQGEVSMHVGPSITFSPMNHLFFHGYFQYCPTFAAIYTGDTENFYGNYASMFVGGCAVSYGPIGLGVEARWGSTTYKPIKSDDAEKWKATLGGCRAYLSFRF